MTEKLLQVFVGEELWFLAVSEEEFMRATTGDEELLETLVARESERRSMALMREQPECQEDESNLSPEESCHAMEKDESRKETFIWPDSAVLLLVEVYREREEEFKAGLKRHNKIWAEIAKALTKAKYNVTSTQCQNKMSGLKRTYKNIKDSNKKSGNHASTWAFYSAMDSIFGEKAWVAPPAVASSDGPQTPAPACSSEFSSSSSGRSEMVTDEKPKPKKRRVETILETFTSHVKEDKRKEREEREKRRVEKELEKQKRWNKSQEEKCQMHNEKMELQRSMIGLLSKIVDRK